MEGVRPVDPCAASLRSSGFPVAVAGSASINEFAGGSTRVRELWAPRTSTSCCPCASRRDNSSTSKRSVDS